MLTFSILRLACADALLLYLALADKVGSRYVTELASTEQEPMYAHVVAGNAVSLPPSCRPDAAWMPDHTRRLAGAKVLACCMLVTPCNGHIHAG